VKDAYVPPPPTPEATADSAPLPNVVAETEGYTIDEIREATRGFFGAVSTNLASVLELPSKPPWPSAYVLGTEGRRILLRVQGLVRHAAMRNQAVRDPSIGTVHRLAQTSAPPARDVLITNWSSRTLCSIVLWYRRLRLFRRRRWRDIAQGRRCDHGADPLGPRPAPRGQHRLSALQPTANVDPF
jgi:hypothetical protein